MKYAVIYARQSSGKEENSESIEAQLNNCRELCRSKKYKIRGEFFDSNTSGRTYPLCAAELAKQDIRFNNWFKNQSSPIKFREEFSKALQTLEDGDMLIVDDTTRIYRPVTGSHLENYVKSYLSDKNIVVLSVKNGVFDPRNFAEEMVDSMQCKVNDQQLAIQKEKSINARKKLKEQGINSAGIKAIGFINRGKHKYDFDEPTAKVIRYIYDCVMNYIPYNQIVREMNEKYTNIFKGRFYASTLYHILDQPLYCGYMYLDDGRLIKSKVIEKTVLSFETWDKVHKIRKSKQTKVHKARFRSLPFSQLISCGKCGANLVTSVDGDIISYHCLVGAIHEHDADCAKSRININTEKNHFTGLKKALAPVLLLAQYKQYEESLGLEKDRIELALVEKEVKNIEDKVSKTNELFLSEKLKLSTFQNLQQQAEVKILNFNKQIKKLQSRLNIDYIGKMLSDPFWGDFETIMHDKLPDAEYERLLRASVNKITSFSDHVIVDTIYGTFQLDRYISGRYRHFPRFEYKIISDSKAKPKNILKCKIEITYLYNNSITKKMIVDFPLMKIFADHGNNLK